MMMLIFKMSCFLFMREPCNSVFFYLNKQSIPNIIGLYMVFAPNDTQERKVFVFQRHATLSKHNVTRLTVIIVLGRF